MRSETRYPRADRSLTTREAVWGGHSRTALRPTALPAYALPAFRPTTSATTKHTMPPSPIAVRTP